MLIKINENKVKQHHLDAYQTKIQARLESFAKELGYDSIVSVCTYATSKVPKFLNDAQRFVDLRDQTWAKAIEIMQAVEAGGKVPTWDELEAQLPTLEA